ncbi:MAG TPA: acyltransferase [Verrucomicrobiae bacterium]|nr:acyltransferase [Verrucomicrobiae bacterium]
MPSLEHSRSGSRVPELDGIRGLAILLVVFFHFAWHSFQHASGTLLHAIGYASILSWSGVDLFFVLSGFLIGGILLDRRDCGNYFRIFYLRRACRILPAYCLWMAVFLSLSWLFLSPQSPQWSLMLFQAGHPAFPKWGYLLFLQNIGIVAGLGVPLGLSPTWSLAVEEQFYLFLPLAMRYLIPRKPVPVLIFLIALAPAVRTFLFLYHPTVFVYVLLPCRADALLLGVLCAHLVRDKGCRRWLENHRDWLYFIFTMLTLGIVYLTISANAKVEWQTVVTSFDVSTFGLSLIALFYACLMLIVVTAPAAAITRIMRTRFLRHFGLIAYGMFLIHLTINDLLHGLIRGEGSDIKDFASAGVTLLAFFVTWLLAYLSWNFFEKPIVAWGRSFEYAPREQAARQITPDAAVS